MRPATAARTAASSALGGWAMSRRRRPVVAAAADALHSSVSTFSPPRQQQQHRRGLPQPARAGARDAAMRELMASRDDARADSLKSKAPLVTKIEWQSPLSIIQYPDPRLRAVNGRVGAFDDELARLSREMFEVMYASEDGGVGLAAPQVGVNLRLMVFNPGKEREKEEEVVLVNPQVISASGPIRGFEEGCLSFPGVYGEVLRPTVVKVKAQRLDGSKFQTTLSGWAGRIFLHEYDHLQGVLFHDRMEERPRQEALPRLARLEELFVEKQGGGEVGGGEPPERAADGRRPV